MVLLQFTPLLWGVVGVGASATTFQVQAFYSGAACEGTPYLVNANEDANCTQNICTPTGGVAVGTTSLECTTDYLSALRGKFGRFPYILQVGSLFQDCKTFRAASGFLASGNCEGSFNANESMGVHFIGTFEANGSATVKYYSGSPCVETQWISTEYVEKETLTDHSCDTDGYWWYSSHDNAAEEKLSIGAIVGLIVACLVVVVVVALFIFRKRRHKKLETQLSLPLTTAILQADETVLHEQVSAGPSALWNDDIIIANRIPRYKIKVKKLISRGAYGEVYHGRFN